MTLRRQLARERAESQVRALLAPRSPPAFAWVDGAECPRCSARLVPKQRRDDGHVFVSCATFPRCRYARDLTTHDHLRTPERPTPPAVERLPTRTGRLVCSECAGAAERLCGPCRLPLCEDCRPEHTHS